jgi:Protein of unknown function (DUF2516)
MGSGYFYGAVEILGYFLVLWSLYDIVRRPAKQFAVVGRGSKNVWIFTAVASAYGLWIQGFAGFVALLACVLYLFDLRPKLSSVV